MQGLPQRMDELEQYEADVNIAHTYGPRFYTYHKMFSAKAANAIIEHSIVINWAKVDDRLLNKIMHGTPSRYCEMYGDFDNATRFCELSMVLPNPKLSLKNLSLTGLA